MQTLEDFVIEKCTECPCCNNDNEYGHDRCNHPNSKIKFGAFEQLPNDKVHDDCPMRERGMILIIKQQQ